MRTLILAAVVAVGGFGAAEAQCLTDFTPQAVASELIAGGYRAVIETADDGQPMIQTGMQGSDVTILLFGCGDGGSCTGMTLRIGFNLADGMTFERINEWNYDNRLSRAFLDNEMDPYLEADVTFAGGISHDNFMTTLGDFDGSLGQFKTFIGWN